MEVYFPKVTIIGVGLIGGSMAMAMKEKEMTEKIIGIGRGLENLKMAKELGAIDLYTRDYREGLDGADLIVLATPVRTIIEIMSHLPPFLKEEVLITDVGSVKAKIVEEAERVFHGKHSFVGSHPIAGSEKSGVSASSPKIFQGKKCIITPTDKTNDMALKKVKTLWEMLGAEIVIMDIEEHDMVFGAVSHLPHVVAYALVNTVEGLRDLKDDILHYAAGGFKDSTRIASSSPEMWRDICLLNRDILLDLLTKYQIRLEEIKRKMEKHDGEGLFEEFFKAKRIRDELYAQRRN